MTESKQNSQSQVDLGLADLLHSLAKNSGEPVEKEMASKNGSDSEAAPDYTVEPLEVLKSLVVAGNWRELARRTEQVLQPARSVSQPDEYSVYARMCWIRSQLELDEMPASILVAPLEVSARQFDSIVPSDDLRSFAGELFGALANRLDASIDGEMKALFQKKSELLIGWQQGNHAEQRKSGAANLKQGRSQNSGIEKSSFDPAATNVKIGIGRQTFQQTSPPPVTARRLAPTSSHSIAMLALIVLGLVIIAAALALRFSDMGRAARSSDTEVLELALQPPVIAFPLNNPELETLSELSRFDPILYDIASRERIPEALRSERPPANSEPGVGQSASQAGASAVGVVSGKKEAIDLSGPIEPQQVRDRKRDGDRIGGLDSSGRKRIPQDDLYSRDISDRPANIGSVYDSNRQYDFKKPVAYEVMVRTEVYGAPSRRSQIVAELREGDEVLAEGVEGSWVRIRSRLGREGFVPKQDLRRATGW